MVIGTSSGGIHFDGVASNVACFVEHLIEICVESWQRELEALLQVIKCSNWKVENI